MTHSIKVVRKFKSEPISRRRVFFFEVSKLTSSSSFSRVRFEEEEEEEGVEGGVMRMCVSDDEDEDDETVEDDVVALGDDDVSLFRFDFVSIDEDEKCSASDAPEDTNEVGSSDTEDDDDDDADTGSKPTCSAMDGVPSCMMSLSLTSMESSLVSAVGASATAAAAMGAVPDDMSVGRTIGDTTLL